MGKKLLVRPKKGVLVPHLESIDTGAKRYIGRVWDPEAHGYRALPEPTEVPTFAESSMYFPMLLSEYVREVRDGALVPADAETAKACGVPFDEKLLIADEGDVVLVAKTPPGTKINDDGRP